MQKTMIAGAVFVLIAGLVYFTHRALFADKVTFETFSSSPDGMYRCHVRETHERGSCRATVRLFRWTGSADEPWELIRTEEVYNDSAVRSNYSVDWQYDAQRRTQGVIVFGDFGTPPFPGEVIFQVRLDGAPRGASGSPRQ